MNKNFTKEFSFRTSRSSGKGGQHVNKVSSRVELLFHVDSSKLLSVKEKALMKKRLHHRISVNGFLSLACEDSRSQHRNKDIAINRFYVLLEKALKVPKKRIPVKMPESINEKRLSHKKANSEKKKMRQAVKYI